MSLIRCLCCGCGRQPSVDAAQHALEHKLVETQTQRKRATLALAFWRRARERLALAMYVYPVLVALLAAAVARWGLLAWVPAVHVYMHTADVAGGDGETASRAKPLLVLAVIATLPELMCVALRRVSGTAITRCESGLVKCADERTQLLARVKTELPMAHALTLLTKYDPEGDHTAFVAAPPHLLATIQDEKEKVSVLVAERAELLHTLNTVLEGMARVCEGGWADARVHLQQLAPVLSKYRAGLPAASNLLLSETAGSIDSMIMGRLVATPMQPRSAMRAVVPSGARSAAPSTMRKEPAPDAAAASALTPSAAPAPRADLQPANLLARLEEEADIDGTPKVAPTKDAQ